MWALFEELFLQLGDEIIPKVFLRHRRHDDSPAVVIEGGVEDQPWTIPPFLALIKTLKGLGSEEAIGQDFSEGGGALVRIKPADLEELSQFNRALIVCGHRPVVLIEKILILRA